MSTIIIATRNRHKTGEIRAIWGAQGAFLSLDDLPGVPALVEDAPTFAGNAMRKASQLAQWILARHPSVLSLSGRSFVLADDSGLEVDALNGAPGVYSARFAADEPGGSGNSPDAANNAKLLRLLENVPAGRRGARFRCVLALIEIPPGPPVPEARLFEGTCEGTLARAAGGTGGFGYDPLFVPLGHVRSFAELGEDVKNALSHRARALGALREWWNREMA